MSDLDTALETWETNKRLFERADGKLPDAEQERLAFIGILPGDISPNVIMEMAKPGFETYAEVRKYTLCLAKVLQHQKRRGRNAYESEAKESTRTCIVFQDFDSEVTEACMLL